MRSKWKKATGILGFALFQKWVEGLLRKLLYSLFKNTIIASAIKLFFCVISVYMAIFKPFGDLYSLWVSSLLFIGVLLWSTVRSISKYYMLPVFIIQKGSVLAGIEKFVEKKYPEAEIGARVYSKVSRFLLGQSRSPSEIILDFIRFLAKDVITFASLFSLYIILVHWVFKPIILEKFAGLPTMQIYLFPIRQLL